MKSFFVKGVALAALATLTLPAALWAQKKGAAAKGGEKEIQRITIVREKNGNEQTTVEIKGDKVLINGKEAKGNSDVQVHVNTTRGGDNQIFFRNGDAWDGNGNFNIDLNRDLNLDLNTDLNNSLSLFSEDANRAMLGVVTDEDEDGAKITSITRESSAEKAGLKVGDVLTKIGDDDVNDAEDVAQAVRTHKPGDKVTVQFLRNGKQQTITAELSKWKGIRINNLNATFAPGAPLAPAAPLRGFGFSNAPKLGLSVQDMDEGKGVKVLDVAAESNAAKAGIKKDDVITHIGEDEVNTTDEVVQAMREARNEASVRFQVTRNGKSQNIEVRIPRTLKTADL